MSLTYPCGPNLRFPEEAMRILEVVVLSYLGFYTGELLEAFLVRNGTFKRDEMAQRGSVETGLKS